jgi:hypothetical protein
VLPPVQEPFRTPVERQDLLQEFEPRGLIEGFYRLRRVVTPGRLDEHRGQGFLVIGRRHLSLHLRLPNGNSEPPFLQSGVRQYRLDGDQLVTTAVMGHSSREDRIVEEPSGLVEQRTWRVVGGFLRIHQSAAAFMEFARIE